MKEAKNIWTRLSGAALFGMIVVGIATNSIAQRHKPVARECADTTLVRAMRDSGNWVRLPVQVGLQPKIGPKPKYAPVYGGNNGWIKIDSADICPPLRAPVVNGHER